MNINSHRIISFNGLMANIRKADITNHTNLYKIFQILILKTTPEKSLSLKEIYFQMFRRKYTKSKKNFNNILEIKKALDIFTRIEKPLVSKKGKGVKSLYNLTPEYKETRSTKFAYGLPTLFMAKISDEDLCSKNFNFIQQILVAAFLVSVKGQTFSKSQIRHFTQLPDSKLNFIFSSLNVQPETVENDCSFAERINYNIEKRTKIKRGLKISEKEHERCLNFLEKNSVKIMWKNLYKIHAFIHFNRQEWTNRYHNDSFHELINNIEHTGVKSLKEIMWNKNEFLEKSEFMNPENSDKMLKKEHNTPSYSKKYRFQNAGLGKKIVRGSAYTEIEKKLLSLDKNRTSQVKKYHEFCAYMKDFFQVQAQKHSTLKVWVGIKEVILDIIAKERFSEDGRTGFIMYISDELNRLKYIEDALRCPLFWNLKSLDRDNAKTEFAFQESRFHSTDDSGAKCERVETETTKDLKVRLFTSSKFKFQFSHFFN